MNIRRTKNIPAAVIRDAMKVAGGMYRLNARESVAYGFCAGEKEVSAGEFLYPQEVEEAKKKYDGLIVYADKMLLDIKSGETRKLR